MQNEVVKVNNQDMSVKEYEGQRVVTFKDIDSVHERPDGTARRTFNTNKKRLLEGEDYFVRNSYEATKEYGVTAPNGLILLTESGYLMLVKSFTDDLAWQVQRQLVKSYFNKYAQMQDLSPELQAIFLHDKKIQQVDSKVEAVKDDLQQFKQDMPILGIEEDKITNAVRRKGAGCLGGKKSNAYADRSLRSRLYRDIYREVYRQFGIGTYKALKRSQCEVAVGIIELYEPPIILKEQIDDCNAQILLGIEVA